MKNVQAISIPHQALPSLWRFIGSLRLGIVLLLLLTADLCLGYACLDGNQSVFRPMNQVGLWQWIQTYGPVHPRATVWFYILLLLLAGLALNMAVCAVDRLYSLYALFTNRRHSIRLPITLSIHTMHLALVAMLLGYLLSYTLSTVYPSLTLIKGATFAIPETDLRVTFDTMEQKVYQGKRLDFFSGRVLDCEILLGLTKGTEQREATLSFNRPVRFHGYTLFLQRFHPKQTGGMSQTLYIIIDIRRDPGSPIILFGMAAFTLALGTYMILSTRSHPFRRKEK